ncbi:MAG: 6-phosphofructokinase [Planctomycetota bacterium]
MVPGIAGGDSIRRVGIIFSGGPAPAANAVISAASLSFLDSQREVIGFRYGYKNLQDYHPISRRLRLDEHYVKFTIPDVSGIRNTRGVIIGSSRANPGAGIRCPADLDDPERTKRLRNIYSALVDLGIDALISIGGDDTLKTANFLHELQKRMPEDAKRVPIVHLPKTIDNDYEGIDFTFGYFTAVDFMAKELQNLRADAASSNSYFIIEAMGRRAGWLAYGVAIAGEANMVYGIEDMTPEMTVEEECVDPQTGEKRMEKRLNLTKLVDLMVRLVIRREEQEKKGYGTIVLAEGLGEAMPESVIRNLPRDPFGHISLRELDIGRVVAKLVSDEYRKRTGRQKKFVGLQIGYESRCSPPHAFDVMLGSQLGIGAYRALVEEGLSGIMVSVSGQLELNYVPLMKLVDPETLSAKLRFIRPGSDFFKLARSL